MTVEFEFDFNSDTNEFTLVNQKIISKGKTKSTSKKSDIKTSIETEGEIPSVTREDNKLVFNNKAIDLLGVTYGDTISLQFDNKGKVITPVIGNSDITGVKGNKITKSGTLSCRGKSNEVLADYGTVFTIIKGKKEGLFELVGENATVQQNDSDDNELELDNVLNDDIDFDTDIDMEEDDKSIEITDFSFE